VQLPYEHFRKAHSFGKNTATSMIHYPPIPLAERDQAVKSDIRSGGTCDSASTMVRRSS
jgi:hypothetical protein